MPTLRAVSLHVVVVKVVCVRTIWSANWAAFSRLTTAKAPNVSFFFCLINFSFFGHAFASEAVSFYVLYLISDFRV